MTNTTPIIIVDIPSDEYLRLPRRSYEFGKGDRRFSDRDRALKHAEAEAIRTGVRQVVRADVTVLGTPMHLVQAVGS